MLQCPAGQIFSQCVRCILEVFRNPVYNRRFIYTGAHGQNAADGSDQVNAENDSGYDQDQFADASWDQMHQICKKRIGK